MLRSIYVPLPDDIRRALLLLAQAERRRPQDTAALIIIEALARSGFVEMVRPPEPAGKTR